MAETSLNEPGRRLLRTIRGAVLVLVVVAAVVGTPRSVHACTCSSDDPFSKDAALVAVAFAGDGVEVLYSDNPVGTTFGAAVFKVDWVYKGQAGPYFVTRLPLNCMPMTTHPDYDISGRDFGFVTMGTSAFPHLRFCDSTVVLDVLVESFGSGYPPDIAILEQQLTDPTDFDQTGIPPETISVLRQVVASDPAVSSYIPAELLRDDQGAVPLAARMGLYIGVALSAIVLAGLLRRRRKRRWVA